MPKGAGEDSCDKQCGGVQVGFGVSIVVRVFVLTHGLRFLILASEVRHVINRGQKVSVFLNFQLKILIICAFCLSKLQLTLSRFHMNAPRVIQF